MCDNHTPHINTPNNCQHFGPVSLDWLRVRIARISYGVRNRLTHVCLINSRIWQLVHCAFWPQVLERTNRHPIHSRSDRIAEVPFGFAVDDFELYLPGLIWPIVVTQWSKQFVIMSMLFSASPLPQSARCIVCKCCETLPNVTSSRLLRLICWMEM